MPGDDGGGGGVVELGVDVPLGADVGALLGVGDGWFGSSPVMGRPEVSPVPGSPGVVALPGDDGVGGADGGNAPLIDGGAEFRLTRPGEVSGALPAPPPLAGEPPP